MTDDLDRFQQAFRTIARDDAVDADRSAPRIEAALVAALRASRPAPRAEPLSRMLGVAIAAALVAGLVAPIWIATRHAPPADPDRGRASPPLEIATAFLPLQYSAVPSTDQRLIRIEVSRTALTAFGLAPIDAVDATKTGIVLADVLVGDDGLARAVRFVRVAHAPGVTP
jgi:hypothetical protein